MINGRGELLEFGGQVMKNVAGYDVSRVLAGSMGTLGLITQVSLKVLPIAPAEATLRFEMDEATFLHYTAAASGNVEGIPVELSLAAETGATEFNFIAAISSILAQRPRSEFVPHKITKAYGAPMLQRLAVLKRRYDPDNVFCHTKSVLG